MTKAIQFKHFDKFEFVEAFIAPISDLKIKEEKKREAVIIAEAIEETQTALLENLATKQDISLLKKDLEITKYQLIGAMATLIVFLPPFVEVIKKMFGF
jgi:hypothetical protein